MKLHLRLAAALAAVAAAFALTSAAIALAAGASVSLKLKHEYRRSRATACHKAEDFRLFHRGATVEWEGYLTPAPAGHFPASLEIKRCAHGSFRKLTIRRTAGKKLSGKFKGFFSARPFAPRSRSRRAITYYSAEASAGGARSKRVYFAVTN